MGPAGRPLPGRKPPPCCFQASSQISVPASCSFQPAPALACPQSPREALAAVFTFPPTLFGFLYASCLRSVKDTWEASGSRGICQSVRRFYGAWVCSEARLWVFEPYFTHLVRTSPRFLKITVLSEVPVPCRVFNFLEGDRFSYLNIISLHVISSRFSPTHSFLTLRSLDDIILTEFRIRLLPGFGHLILLGLLSHV